MFNYFFNIGLTYLIIGFAVSLFFYFILRKPVFGRFWGTLIIALVGAFLGGMIEYFFADFLERLANLNNSVNIFPPIITSFILIWLFSLVSDKKE
jgi:uncharacterized membrane protein YeaQ/YmgE (transglycosylase-associated protein family)